MFFRQFAITIYIYILYLSIYHIYHQYSIFRYKIHIPWLVKHHFFFCIKTSMILPISHGVPWLIPGSPSSLRKGLGPLQYLYLQPLGVFTHIFVKFAQVRQCWAWTKKKTQQPTNDQTWYKWTRFGSSQNSEPEKDPQGPRLSFSTGLFHRTFPPDIHRAACVYSSFMPVWLWAKRNKRPRHVLPKVIWKNWVFHGEKNGGKHLLEWRGKPWLRMVHTGQ